MAHTGSVQARHKDALLQHPIPNCIELPNMHFVSNGLPGRTSSMEKRLRHLQKIYTVNGFVYFTKNFNNRQINLRTGLPVAAGQGIGKKIKEKKKENEREFLEK